MKYILIASLLSSAAYAAPYAQVQGGNVNTPTGQTQQLPQQGQQVPQQGQQVPQQGQQGVNAPPTGLGAGIANGQTPSANDLATAVSNWMADTSMVSNFLNTGNSIQNNVAFKQAATVAFNAEVDELNHKAIIDAANGNDPNVIAANSTLATGGSFQDVVDKLQEMSVKGQAAAGNIDLINQNRCVNVLPNIDAYMASTGSSSQAVRPTVCDQTGVAGGVQGTGRTLPGAPAGSPAAAFAAAQSLAAGTGNGLVQNGVQQGQQIQQGQAPTQQQTPTQGQQIQQGQAPTQQQTPTQGQQIQQGQTPTQGQQIQQGQAPTQGQDPNAQQIQQGQNGQLPAQGQQTAQNGQTAQQGQLPAGGAQTGATQ